MIKCKERPWCLLSVDVMRTIKLRMSTELIEQCPKPVIQFLIILTSYGRKFAVEKKHITCLLHFELLWQCIHKTTALAKFNLLCDKVKSCGSEGYKSSHSFDSREIQVRKMNWIVLICFYTRKSSGICSIFRREEIEFDISVIYFSLNNWLF